jgi:hypothetical protein
LPCTLGRIELWLLLEQADGRAGRQLRLAAILLVDPGHDPQQRRLAGAVEAEHADLGAREERERDVLEDLFVVRSPRACTALVDSGNGNEVDPAAPESSRSITRSDDGRGRPHGRDRYA